MCAHAQIKEPLRGHYVVMYQDTLFSTFPPPPHLSLVVNWLIKTGSQAFLFSLCDCFGLGFSV